MHEHFHADPHERALAGTERFIVKRALKVLADQGMPAARIKLKGHLAHLHGERHNETPP